MNKSDKKILSSFLIDSGINQSVESVLGLIKGVAAAPEYSSLTANSKNWLGLISPNLPENLAKILVSELENIINVDDGLNSGHDIETFKKRLLNLRRELKNKNITGFMVPLADEHQGEYIPKNAQRLTWLTGFTGSAGIAIVLNTKAAIFVDGRYTLQANMQVNKNLFQINSLTQKTLNTWISETLTSGSKLGFDSWLHTPDDINRLKESCDKAGIELTALDTNPIDTIWTNQPCPPLTPVVIMDSALTGQTSPNKRARISKKLKRNSLAACVLTAPDSIAWLANIRGNDVPYTPFCLAFAIFYSDGSLDIYSDPRKFSTNIREKLGPNIRVLPNKDFLPALRAMGKKNSKVGIDYSSSAEIIKNTLTLSGATVQRISDPCQLPKAKKNPIELDGIRKAHLRDGIALTKFLAWVMENSPNNNLTELSAATKLEGFRREEKNIQGLSFPTISGMGPNAAIVHYRATKESNRKFEQNSLYLVDSGAQYLDGTTDVTRTVAIGIPTDEMKDRFTRVLKGHIALATAVFPKGTTGSQLDILARLPLWEIGLDYNHGTGHGVGSYLGVHEGPQRISKQPNHIALEPGMVISNEPGYYKPNEYGIRIENLVTVMEASNQSFDIKRDDHSLLCFETLTLVPIDLKLIEKKLLNTREINWVNTYHQKIRESLAPLLDTKTQGWLELNTQAIKL